MKNVLGLPSIEFPSPRQSLAEGLVAVGGRVDPATLFEAYSLGIFPWPQEGLPMLWFCPAQRGILEFSDFHVSNSLQKFRRRHGDWALTRNTAFREVIEACARQPRPFQHGTWITTEMIQAYCRMNELGYAHSFEVWENGSLVGGIYGMLIQGVFSGESMFHRQPNASKMAFWHLLECLQAEGHSWMDIQMITPVTQAFGGKYLPRDEYLEKLKSRQREFQRLVSAEDD